MVRIPQKQRNAAALTAMYYSDYGFTLLYNRTNVTGATPGTVQYNGIGRAGVRVDSGSTAIGVPIKSVWVYCRKYGNPTGNINIGVRKASDDSLVTIGTWFITSFNNVQDFSFVVRNRQNTYATAVNDVISIEFPSSATDGFTLLTNTSLGNPTGYTGRQHIGTSWANTSNPPAIIVKG